MKNLKKVLVAASLCAAISATAIAGTLAYFTDTETKTNTFTVGDLSIILNEDWTPEDGLNIVPGRDMTKQPDVTLTGVNGYVRIKVEVKAKNSIQQDALDALLAGEENKNISIDYNTSQWTKDGDYYYYNSVLANGNTTGDLFTTVSIGDDLNDELEDISEGFDIVLTAYAVQEEGFEASEYASVLEAAKAAFEASFPESD